MSMFGARFAVFVRRARVLPSPCPATRNLSFLRFHRHRHPVVSTRCFTGLVRVGVKIPQDGNRTKRVVFILEVSPTSVTCSFNLGSPHWVVLGRIESQRRTIIEISTIKKEKTDTVLHGQLLYLYTSMSFIKFTPFSSLILSNI